MGNMNGGIDMHYEILLCINPFSMNNWGPWYVMGKKYYNGIEIIVTDATGFYRVKNNEMCMDL